MMPNINIIVGSSVAIIVALIAILGRVYITSHEDVKKLGWWCFKTLNYGSIIFCTIRPLLRISELGKAGNEVTAPIVKTMVFEGITVGIFVMLFLITFMTDMLTFVTFLDRKKNSKK